MLHWYPWECESGESLAETQVSLKTRSGARLWTPCLTVPSRRRIRRFLDGSSQAMDSPLQTPSFGPYGLGGITWHQLGTTGKVTGRRCCSSPNSGRETQGGAAIRRTLSQYIKCFPICCVLFKANHLAKMQRLLGGRCELSVCVSNLKGTYYWQRRKQRPWLFNLLLQTQLVGLAVEPVRRTRLSSPGIL